jgi:hypothetical protein
LIFLGISEAVRLAFGIIRHAAARFPVEIEPT